MFAFLPIISLIKSADKAEEIYGLRGITSLFLFFSFYNIILGKKRPF